MIALAIVLSMEPVILFLDEPSAGLDPRARQNLIGLLTDMTQSMIIASHDLEMVTQFFQELLLWTMGRL